MLEQVLSRSFAAHLAMSRCDIADNVKTSLDLAAILNQDEANPMSAEWPDALPGPIGPMG